MVSPDAVQHAATPGERIRWRDHEGGALDRVNDYDTIACERCGFVHVIPLPTDADLAQIYKETYYAETKPDYLKRARQDESWAKLGIDDKLDLLSAHLLPSRRALLDVGSGPGFFAKRAMERGWQAQGIDPSRQAAIHGRSLGVRIAHAFYDDVVAAALGTFDAVTLTNMLEHVSDPAALLKRAHGNLGSGGLICVTVPNDYNLLQLALRRGVGLPPWWLAPPHHINYFTFNSLATLLARCGFEEVARSTSFPMELFALMGDLYPGNDALGRACHAKRVAFDLSFTRADLPEARKLFYSALAEAGMGREAIVVARKL